MKQFAESVLEVWEPRTDDGNLLVPGADFTLTCWRDQHQVCELLNAEFSPPDPDQMCAVSAGVMEGELPIEGVRYRAPGHMSGWYITTDRYSGHIADMRVEHCYHVTARRVDIVRYLALPAGHRFFLWRDAQGLNDQVRFDEREAMRHE